MRKSLLNKRFRLCLYGFIVVAIMAFIFAMSAMPAKESSHLSGNITSYVIRMLYPEYSGLTKEEQTGIYSRTEHVIRKCAHFSEYAVLGVFLALFFRELSFSFNSIAAFLTAALYASSDEWHQSFIDGRGPAFSDVLIDSAGVCFGIVLIVLFMSSKDRKIQRSSH